MCGLSGIVSLGGQRLPDVHASLAVMNRLLAHRGPDAEGTWVSEDGVAGFAHKRLTIIDLSDSGRQPMAGADGSVVVFNGEVYNYVELRERYADRWQFRTRSDTETILAAHAARGVDCMTELRGMFSFAIWEPRARRLVCARDRFGIKPFYYAVVGDTFLFASEAKALMPFLPAISTDSDALAEYLTFQYTIGEHTLFQGVRQLLPGHALVVENGTVRTWRYWDVSYEIDYEHSQAWFSRRLEELLDESMRLHLRADVPIGSYLSGGIDSSLVAALAARHSDRNNCSFHGKFTCHPGYDESHYARAVAQATGNELHEVDITSDDFLARIGDVIYHLDTPVAGPGSFPQYMVAQLASRHRKVVLGGQGGDEIFGGYARYLVAYFEQCIKAAIDGTYRNGHFVVTIESIVPNLGLLREYKPLLKEFWREGLFDGLDERYFRLVDRSTDMRDEVDWSQLDRPAVKERFMAIFNNRANVRKEAYFDSMTHFDFKCLLPALLHVEDRMSMAHGLESRVPLLDHPLIEFVATIPADIKFEGGQMKHLLKTTFGEHLPRELLERRDKMGFPVPLKEWFGAELGGFVNDIFASRRAAERPFLNAEAARRSFASAGRFSRKTWGLLSLELWQQRFHDRAGEFRAMLDEARAEAAA